VGGRGAHSGLGGRFDAEFIKNRTSYYYIRIIIFRFMVHMGSIAESSNIRERGEGSAAVW
jgi:hypothetical protein